jgi:hypothetical protein
MTFLLSSSQSNSNSDVHLVSHTSKMKATGMLTENQLKKKRNFPPEWMNNHRVYSRELTS